MTTRQHAHSNRTRSRKPRTRGALLLVGAALLTVLAGGVWLSGNGTEAAPALEPASVALPVANLPVIVQGVEVKQPAVDRGKLPLDTTVTQAYQLVNVGSGTVQIGKPAIEVLDGCCPPEPQVSQQSVAPGQATTVSLSMQMHEGMDGPHLFHVVVPVRTAEGEDALHLYFKGDFGG